MNRFIEKIKKSETRILFTLIFSYVIILTSFSFWKYFNFLYNGIDLAIYNQVFFNTSFGRLFQMSIHPQSYLGDHFELFILFLTPIYYLFKSPLTLLFLQSLFLGLTAWPVYLIAKKVFKDVKNSYLYSLIIVCIVLLNPIFWNINLFDFHILPFAIFFLLFAFYFYLTQNFLLYIIFLLIALTVREDVSLVVVMFGVLPFLQIQKIKEIKQVFINQLKWVIAPVLIAIVWFILAMKMSAYFNPDSSYKFLVYYGWLGGSGGFLGLLQSIIGQPINVLLHIINFSNLVMLSVLFLSFAFLPLFGKRYLVLFLIIFFQIALSAGSWAGLITSTHYSTLFLPAMIIGSIYGLKSFISWRDQKILEWKTNQVVKVAILNFSAVVKIIVQDKYLLGLFLIVTIAFGNLALGTSIGMIQSVFNSQIKLETQIAKKLVDTIPDNASVVASFKFLPNLSNREDLYSLHYGFFGKRQFSDVDYFFPSDVDYYIIDTNDFITYKLQSLDDAVKLDQYNSGFSRLMKYLENYETVAVYDSNMLFKKNTSNSGIEKLVSIKQENEYYDDRMVINDKLSLLGYKKNGFETKFNDYTIKPYSFLWKSEIGINDNYELNINIVDSNQKIVWTKYYPLGYGIYPTREWGNNRVETNYWFIVPNEFLSSNYKISLDIVNIKEGYAGLDKIRSAYNFIDKNDDTIPLLEIN